MFVTRPEGDAGRWVSLFSFFFFPLFCFLFPLYPLLYSSSSRFAFDTNKTKNDKNSCDNMTAAVILLPTRAKAAASAAVK